MDKIITDGVDVSGCEFSCENPIHEIKHSCNVRGYEKDNGLHIHLKCKNNPNCYYKQLQRAKAEIEELKAENEKLKEENKFALEQYNFKRIHWEVENAENLKLRQCLKEIKEMCDKHIKAEQIVMAQEVIDKISECIGAE